MNDTSTASSSEKSVRAIRVFVDMDGVVVDFDGYKDEHGLTGDEVKRTPGAYLAMPAIPGAIAAVRSLIGMGYEVWMATKAPTGVSYAYSDKAQWVMDNIPELKRRIIITHDKGLLGAPGDYLIDDRPHKANCERFPGTLIRFTDGMTWADVLDRLRKDSRTGAETDSGYDSAYQTAIRRGLDAPLHPDTAALVDRFCFALKKKLLAAQIKHGYTDGWRLTDWMDECRSKLVEHVAKGDPRDVANYCMFLWHHGERTELPNTKISVPPMQEIYDRMRPKWTEFGYTDVEMKARAFDTHQDMVYLLASVIELVPPPTPSRALYRDRVASSAADHLRAEQDLRGIQVPLHALGLPGRHVIYGDTCSVRLHADILPDPHTGSVKDYSGSDLTRRALLNLFNRDRSSKPRWAVVSRTFGLGSTYSAELCRLHSLDPDEDMPGIECEACVALAAEEDAEDVVTTDKPHPSAVEAASPPEATTELPWAQHPDARWAAADADEEVYFFLAKPVPLDASWIHSSASPMCRHLPGVRIPGNWTESLTPRPEGV